MTTQYTPTLKLALPVTGELSGTWGDVVNDNITSMIEQAIAGLATINSWTGNAHTLTTANGTTSESRCAMLVAATGGGAPSAAAEIICPAAAKLYVLQNNTSYAVTLKTSAGTGVAVAAGDTAFLFCDGTNVNSCVTTIVNGHITGNLTVDGNATINGNTTLGNATSDTVTVTARVASNVLPSADNTYDLGASANAWKDLYIDGTATMALVAISGGTINGVSIGATTPATFLAVDNLSLDGNTIASTNTNGNIVIAPNGTGDVQLDADTVRVGDSGAAATLTSNGAGALTVTTGGAADLTLSTNSGTDSGTVVIANGANGNITLTPNGTGDVILSADRVQIGDSNTDTTLTTNGTGSLNLTTNNGTNSGTIQIAQGVNGNITLTPNGTGSVSVPKLVWSNGTATRVPYLTTGGQFTDSANLTFNGTDLTVSGAVNAGSIAATTLDLTNLEVTNIKAKDGTAAMTIADSTGAVTVSSAFSTQGNTTLGNAAADNVTVTGTITSNLIFTDNTYDIGASGATRPRNLYLAGDATIGGSIAATTLDLTNLEVTNIKAKDGTASITIADSTGAVSFANNVTLGDASTDTVTVNGYMGIGGAADSQYGLYVQSSALTGTNQRGIFAIPTATSAATSTISAIFAYPKTAAASFTVSTAASFRADDAVKGAGSTITNLHGLYIADQTQGTNNYGVTSAVSSGSNKWNIYASGTAQNYFAGNVGVKVSSPSTSLAVATAATTDNTFNSAIVVGPTGTETQGGSIGSRTASANQRQGLYVKSNQTLTLWGDASGDGDLVLEVVTGTSPSVTTGANAIFQLGSTGSLVTLPTAGGAAVFNENGVDADFRVESDTNTHALFVDAGNSRVGINNSAPAGDLDVIGTVGTYLSQSGVGSNQRLLYLKQFNDFGYSFNIDSQNTGALKIKAVNNGTETDFITWDRASAIVGQTNYGYAVFNENGVDADFRVESDTNTHALFVDAGNSRVGVNISGPNAPLHVDGPVDSLAVHISAPLYQNSGTSLSKYLDVKIGNSYLSNYAIGQVKLRAYGNIWNNSASALEMYTQTGSGTDVSNLYMDATESVFNQSSADVDFRVESDTNTHAFFVDAGNNRIGFSDSAPDTAWSLSTTNSSATGNMKFNGVKKAAIQGQKSGSTAVTVRCWFSNYSSAMITFMYAHTNGGDGFSFAQIAVGNAYGTMYNQTVASKLTNDFASPITFTANTPTGSGGNNYVYFTMPAGNASPGYYTITVEGVSAAGGSGFWFETV